MRTATLENGTLVVRVPLQFKKYRANKTLLVAPGSRENQPEPNRQLLKWLATAHLWKRHLAKGKYQSFSDIGHAMNVNPTYVGRIFNLNFISPKIKQAILTGEHPPQLMLKDLIKDVPLLWEEQEAVLCAGGDNNAN